MSKQGMMERLDWYIELRRIYNFIKENNSAEKIKLLQALAENYLSFNLKSSKEFFEISTVQGLSFSEIWNHIENMPRLFHWDELLNSLFNLNQKIIQPLIPDQKKQPKLIETNKTTEKTGGTSAFKKDFPLVKFYNLCEVKMSRTLKQLSLGGNLITNANYEFPSSLTLLNLSYNQISDFLPIKPLINLKFLNLSHNLIEDLKDITSIITLVELFISHNKLTQANFLFSIKNLTLLDLSHNRIENFEDVALLCTSSELQTLSLSGNPLSQKPRYKTSVKTVVPSLLHFDPKCTTQYSKFQDMGFSEPPDKSSSPGISFLLNTELNFPIFSSFSSQRPVSSFGGPGKSKQFFNESFSPAPCREIKQKNFESQREHRRSKSNMSNGSDPATPNLNYLKVEASKARTNASAHKRVKSKSRLKEFSEQSSVVMNGQQCSSNIFKPKKRSNTVIAEMDKFKGKVGSV